MKSPLVIAFLTLLVVGIGGAMILPLLHMKNQEAFAEHKLPLIALGAAVFAFIVAPRKD